MLHNNIEYVICGYINSNKGYDWNGCGKDWCAKCNKMLCKSWDLNQLWAFDGYISVDWYNRTLKDNTDCISADWQQKQLYYK